MTTIPAAVRAVERDHGGRPALLDEGSWWTWAELATQIRLAGAAFLARGLEPGDRVAVWAPNRREWMVAALGAQYVGLAVVPLNTRYRGEAAEIVVRSGVRALVVDQGFLGTDHLGLLGDSRPEVVVTLGSGWDSFLAAATPSDRRRAELCADEVTPDTVADILFTSGTTGAPKGATAGHRRTLEVARVWGELAEVGPQDRYLVVNPFFHSFGSKAGYLVCLLTGAACLPVPVFDAADVLRRVAAEGVTLLPGAPTLFTSLLDQPGAPGALASLRLAVTGAAVVPESLISRMREELGIDAVVTAYGLTEAPVVTMCRPSDDAATVASTCGRPVPGVSVRTVGEDGADTAVGEPGEVLVRGPQTMTGYLDDPAATAATLDDDGWLHTGDVGVLDERGYLRITDRKKDLVVVGGFNVYPAEVERVLAGHPDVAESAVVGAPDERMGEVPIAYVRARAGHTVDPDGLTVWAKERLANFKVPRGVVVVEDLPRNAGGKVLKTELRAQGRPSAAGRP